MGRQPEKYAIGAKDIRKTTGGGDGVTVA